MEKTKYHAKPLLPRLKKLFQRDSLRELSTSEYRTNVLLAILIGVAGGYGAVLFRFAVGIVGRLAFGVSEPTMEALIDLPWYLKLGLPVLGGLLVGPIVTRFAAEAKGHGVPEVMASVATKGGIIRGRVAAAKVVASAVTIGTGGSAGSEGPIVQIGSGIASTVGQWLKMSPRRLKTFVGCGAAAGIAATFNAPVGGMLFAVEIVLGDFGMAQLSPIIISSVVATAVSRMHLGDAPAFEVPEYILQSPIELVHYAILGVVAAVFAVLFTLVLHNTEERFEKLRIPEWIKPAIGGLIIGLLGVSGLPHVYGVGYEFIEEALLGHLSIGLLAMLIFAKIIATSATLGSGGSGGIFAPSLFIGAMAGGIVWYGAHAITPDLVTSNYGAYSLVGMAAVVAATTRAPLQAILILFELTGGYEVILPLMLSSITAVIISTVLFEDSIYTIKLRAKGIILNRGKEVNVLKNIRVSEVMRSDVHTVPHNMRLRPLLDEVSEDKGHSSIFVLDKDKKIKGSISFHEIRSVLFDVEALEPVIVADDIADLNVAKVKPNDTLDVVIRLFASNNQDELPVVDPKDSCQLLGSIHRADVVDAYNHEILKRDMLGSVSAAIGEMEKMRQAELAPGFTMAEVDLPSNFAGKNLRELDFRNKYKLEILLVRRYNTHTKDKMDSVVPTPDITLQYGDVLLVSGPQTVVEDLSGVRFNKIFFNHGII